MDTGTRLLLTVEAESIKKIDAILDKINDDKGTFQSRTNRQALINALIIFALAQDLKFRSWGRKYVRIRPNE